MSWAPASAGDASSARRERAIAMRSTGDALLTPDPCTRSTRLSLPVDTWAVYRFRPRSLALVVLCLMSQLVSHRVRLARVVGHMEDLVLDEGAPCAPLTGIWIVHPLPGKDRLGGLMDPRHLLEHRAGAELDFKRVVDMGRVVSEGVVEKQALDR